MTEIYKQEMPALNKRFGESGDRIVELSTKPPTGCKMFEGFIVTQYVSE